MIVSSFIHSWLKPHSQGSKFIVLGLVSCALVHGAWADNENLALGNPSQAKVFAVDEKNDLNNLLVQHPAFDLGFDESQGGPKWVSWHLAQSDRGKSGRTGTFRPDALLPETSRIRPNDYRGSGYDRGHMCPSADRTVDKDLNASTFLMSNMLPQTPDLNQQLWRKFEEYCRNQLSQGENEMYLISGGVGSIERIADGKVNVPEKCWKIAVILPSGDDDVKRINADTRVIAVMMPNKTGTEIAKGAWASFITSVDKIEEETGLDFLSNLPVELQTVIEAKVDSGRATKAPRNANDAAGAGTKAPAVPDTNEEDETDE